MKQLAKYNVMRSKHVILLTSKFIQHLDIPALRRELPFLLLTLIVDETEEKDVSEEVRQNFDYFHVISGSDHRGPMVSLNYSEVEQRVREIVSTYGNKNTSVVTFSEICVGLVGKMNDLFDLEGISEKESNIFRNKELMKSFLNKAQIRTPRFHQYNPLESKKSIIEYFLKLKREIGLPFIVKPCESALCFGVRKINSQVDFENWVNNESNEESTYSIEEFISGQLFHCETIILKGKIIFCEASRYSCPVMEYFSGKSLGSVILNDKSDIRNEIVLFCKNVLAAMGNPEGVTHMEIFQNSAGELVFLEVGARPPGGMISDMIDKTFNINMVNLHLKITSGLQKSNVKINKRHSHYFWMYFPKNKGEVKEVRAPRISSNHNINWYVKKGDVILKNDQQLDKSCSVIANNTNYEVLAEDFDRLSKSVVVISK